MIITSSYCHIVIKLVSKHMKRTILLLIAFFISSNFLFAQSNFTNGFNNGYKKGYCHDQGIGCLEPISPIAPIPKIGESNDSYTDGYNRGFQMGLSVQKSSTSTTNRQQYTTTNGAFVENKMSNSYGNTKDAYALANAIKDSKDRALENLKYKQYQAVKDICLAGLSISPKDEDFMMILGEAYYQSGDNNNALKWLKKAANYRNEPNLNKKIKSIESGNIGNQNQVNKTGSQSKIDSEKIDNLLKINPLMKEGKYIEAIESIDKGLGNTEYHILYGQRGIANYQLKNYSEAISDITKSDKDANKIKPDLLVYRGISKSKLNDYYGAIADYNIIIENYASTYKDMASVYNNKAYTLILLNKLEEAIPLIDKALELNTSRDYIWDTKGELELKLGNYKECVIAMQKAIEISPTYGHAFLLKGIANIKLNNKSQGCLDLSRAGELGESKAYEEIKKYCN